MPFPHCSHGICVPFERGKVGIGSEDWGGEQSKGQTWRAQDQVRAKLSSSKLPARGQSNDGQRLPLTAEDQDPNRVPLLLRLLSKLHGSPSLPPSISGELPQSPQLTTHARSEGLHSNLSARECAEERTMFSARMLTGRSEKRSNAKEAGG